MNSFKTFVVLSFTTLGVIALAGCPGKNNNPTNPSNLPTDTPVPFTPTNTSTSTTTGTPTKTTTATPSGTSTSTATDSMTPTASLTATPSASPTPTGTSTDTATVTPTSTNTGTPTHTATSTDTPTNTYTPTITDTPTVTSTSTWTGTPTATCVGGGQAGTTINTGATFGVNTFMDSWAVTFSSTYAIKDWEVNVSTLPSSWTIALFNDTGSNYPGTQISGTLANVTANSTGWIDTAITSPVTVASNTTYWIGLWSSTAASIYDNNTFDTETFYVVNLGSFPSTFPSGATNDTGYWGPLEVALNYCP